MESGGLLILLGLDFLVLLRVVNELGEFLVVVVFVFVITDAAEDAISLFVGQVGLSIDESVASSPLRRPRDLRFGLSCGGGLHQFKGIGRCVGSWDLSCRRTNILRLVLCIGVWLSLFDLRLGIVRRGHNFRGSQLGRSHFSDALEIGERFGATQSIRTLRGGRTLRDLRRGLSRRKLGLFHGLRLRVERAVSLAMRPQRRVGRRIKVGGGTSLSEKPASSRV